MIKKCNTIKIFAVGAFSSLLTDTAVGCLLYSIWTQWRFRLILSGLLRVHGNTNEIWPVSTGGSRHGALSCNVDGLHLGARLDSR